MTRLGSGSGVGFDLTGRRVLITAGASGIGLAIAKGFLASGARVLVCDIDENALNEVDGGDGDLTALRCDVAEEDDVGALFDRIDSLFGGLDVLVNNAGIAGPTGRIEDLELDDWRRTLEVGLTSQFLCSRGAVPCLRAAGGGSIVNISSTAGLFGYPLRTPYASAKWGVIGLTKSLAMELGPDRIRVNAVCPGPVSGDRMDRVIAAEAAATGVDPEAIRQGYTRSVSLRSFVDPEEIAATVLFLCSDLGAKISGQALSVDGHTESLTG